MPPDSPSPNDHPHVEPSFETSPRPSSSSLGSLSKSIRGRTTDLLAIGIVVIAGLTFGRQIIHWWHDDEPLSMPRSRTPSVWGAGGAPVDLKFGDLKLDMTRLAISGTEAEAHKQLVAMCSEKTQTALWPQGLPDKSEQTLLERLKTLKPAAAEAGVWEVHLLERPMVMAVGVRTAKPAGESKSRGESGSSTVEQPQRRVVCWGWLMPSGDRTWNGYCLQPAGASGEVAAGGLPECPLPPQSRRLLSLAAGSTGQMTSFYGPGPVDAWMRFFDEWVERQTRGATGTIRWQTLQGGWTGSWRGPVTDKGVAIEVSWYLTPDPRTTGNWQGVVDVIPVIQPRGTP